MIYVGVDDTDMPGTPGTNKFAKALAIRLTDKFECELIVRHQLLFDPRVPYTSKNSSASLLLHPKNGAGAAQLIDELRGFVSEWFVEGSDPGFCVTETIPAEVTAYGKRCQSEVIDQSEPRNLAVKHGIHLEGCGGTNDGIIGALAAVGLVADGNDGRVVQIGAWPDDLTGPEDIKTVRARNVEVRCLESETEVKSGTIDVGKHLRPNYRGGKIVLFARPQSETDGSNGSGQSSDWRAIRFT
ncbi:MAG: hypothetical protein JXM70_05445 [Pirellulales bacterium]|nr:hypothetical protein [Pirellulales bacterium]